MDRSSPLSVLEIGGAWCGACLGSFTAPLAGKRTGAAGQDSAGTFNSSVSGQLCLDLEAGGTTDLWDGAGSRLPPLFHSVSQIKIQTDSCNRHTITIL